MFGVFARFLLVIAGYCRLLSEVCLKSNNLKTGSKIIIYRVNYTSSVSVSSVLTIYFSPLVLPKYSLLILMYESLSKFFPPDDS